jgi:hypothetical protein
MQTSLMMSVYLTISLTMERFMSVVYPLLHLRHHSCFCLAAPGMVFSIIFTLPTYFMLNTTSMVTNKPFDISNLHEVSRCDTEAEDCIQFFISQEKGFHLELSMGGGG